MEPMGGGGGGGGGGGDALTAKQASHAPTYCSISLSNCGHQT